MTTITITFSSQVENHNKNQLIGEMEEKGEGFNIEDIEKCIKIMKNKCETELIDLNKEGLENCGYEKLVTFCHGDAKPNNFLFRNIE